MTLLRDEAMRGAIAAFLNEPEELCPTCGRPVPHELGSIEAMRLRKRLPTPELCRAIREAAGISQQSIATDLKVARTTVARWEAGLRRPRGRLLQEYVDALEAMLE